MAKILIVDDSRDILRTFQLVLNDHDVYTAQSGRDGLDVLAAAKEAGQPFDILLLDVMMPNMSGIDMARIVRHSDDEVKIAFLSAYLQCVTPREIEEMKISGVLQKPMAIAELRGLVAQLAE